MKKITQMITFIAAIGLVVPAWADTLVLKNGERITGYYEGGTARVIKFRSADGTVKDYDLLSMQQIQFPRTRQSRLRRPFRCRRPRWSPHPRRLLQLLLRLRLQFRQRTRGFFRVISALPVRFLQLPPQRDLRSQRARK